VRYRAALLPELGVPPLAGLLPESGLQMYGFDAITAKECVKQSNISLSKANIDLFFL
jgi:hypothetical protein